MSDLTLEATNQTDLDTYRTAAFVTVNNLDAALARAEAFGIKVISNSIELEVLDKPFLYRLELSGREAALTQFSRKR